MLAVSTFDDGEAGEPGVSHAMDDNAQRLVGMSDRRRSANHLYQFLGAVASIDDALEIDACDDADHAPRFIHHREQPLRPFLRIDLQSSPQHIGARCSRQDSDIRMHYFFREEDLEWIDCILSAEMESTTRDLLGQDRSTEEEHCESVRECNRDEQRQQHVDIVRELEHEHDTSEWRAHRTAKYGAHADERPEA